MNPYLFVYGTLRPSNQSAMSLWLAQQAKLLDKAVMPGRLYDVGGYPGLIAPFQPEERVVGELFWLPQPQAVLASLDNYEECAPTFPAPQEYLRMLLPAALSDGRTLEAWVYVYNWPVQDKTLVATGDWHT